MHGLWWSNPALSRCGPWGCALVLSPVGGDGRGPFHRAVMTKCINACRTHWSIWPMALAQQTFVVLLNTHSVGEGREAERKGDFPKTHREPASQGGCDAHQAAGLLTHTSGAPRPSLTACPASGHRHSKDIRNTAPGSSQQGKECDYLEP